MEHRTAGQEWPRTASATETWSPPVRVELPTGHHLRPVRATDVDLHMQAVTGSRERLWTQFGAGCGWPAPTLSAEQDRQDLLRCEAAARAGTSFCYALFDLGETELLGGVHLAPSGPVGGRTELTWWVVDWLVGGPVDAAVAALAAAWSTGGGPGS